MDKANRDKGFSKKNARNGGGCKIGQNCNVSDVTDSVEFADEPFADINRKKKCSKQDDNNQCR